MLEKDKFNLLKADLKLFETLKKHRFSIDNSQINIINQGLKTLNDTSKIYLASKGAIESNSLEDLPLSPHFLHMTSANQPGAWIRREGQELPPSARRLPYSDAIQYIEDNESIFIHLATGGIAQGVLDWEQLKELFEWSEQIIPQNDAPSLIFVDNAEGRSIALALACFCELGKDGGSLRNYEQHIALLKSKFDLVEDNNPGILQQAVNIYVQLNMARLFKLLTSEIRGLLKEATLIGHEIAKFEKRKDGVIDWASAKNRIKLRAVLVNDPTEQDKVLFNYLEQLEKCLTFFENEKVLPKCNLLELNFDARYLSNALKKIDHNQTETFSDLLREPIRACGGIADCPERGNGSIHHAVFGDGRLEDISWLLECLDSDKVETKFIQQIIFKHSDISGYLSKKEGDYWRFEVSQVNAEYADPERKEFTLSEDEIINTLIESFRVKHHVSFEEAKSRILLNIQGPAGLLHTLGGVFASLFPARNRPFLLKELSDNLQWTKKPGKSKDQLIYSFSYGVNSSVPCVNFEYICKLRNHKVEQGLEPVALKVTFNLDSRDADQVFLMKQVKEKCEALGCPVSFENSNRRKLQFSGEKPRRLSSEDLSKEAPKSTLAEVESFIAPYGHGRSLSFISMPKKKIALPIKKISDESNEFVALRAAISSSNIEAINILEKNSEKKSLLKKLITKSKQLKDNEKEGVLKACEFGMISSQKCPKYDSQNVVASWQAISQYIDRLIEAFPHDEFLAPEIREHCASRLYYCILKVFKTLGADLNGLEAKIKDFFIIYENSSLVGKESKEISEIINWLIEDFKADRTEQDTKVLLEHLKTYTTVVYFDFNILKNHLKNWMMTHFKRSIFVPLLDATSSDFLNYGPIAVRRFISFSLELQDVGHFFSLDDDQLKQKLLNFIDKFPGDFLGGDLHDYCAESLRNALQFAFRVYYKLEDEDSTEINEAVSIFSNSLKTQQLKNCWDDCKKTIEKLSENICSVFSKIDEATFLKLYQEKGKSNHYHFFIRAVEGNRPTPSSVLLQSWISLNDINAQGKLPEKYKPKLREFFYQLNLLIPDELNHFDTAEQYIIVNRLIEKSCYLPEDFSNPFADFIRRASSNDKDRIIWLNKVCHYLSSQGFNSKENFKLLQLFFDEVIAYFKRPHISAKQLFIDADETVLLANSFELAKLYSQQRSSIEEDKLEKKEVGESVISKLDVKILDLLLWDCSVQPDINNFFSILLDFWNVVDQADPVKKDKRVFYPVISDQKKKMLNDKLDNNLYRVFLFELAIIHFKKSQMGEGFYFDKTSEAFKKAAQFLQGACYDENGFKDAFLVRALVNYVTLDLSDFNKIKEIRNDLEYYLLKEKEDKDKKNKKEWFLNYKFPWVSPFFEPLINQMINDSRLFGVVLHNQDDVLFELADLNTVQTNFEAKYNEQQKISEQLSKLTSSVFHAYHYLFQTDLWQELREEGELGDFADKQPLCHFKGTQEGKQTLLGAQERWKSVLADLANLHRQPEVTEAELNNIKEKLRVLATEEKEAHPSGKTKFQVQNDSARGMIDAILRHSDAPRISEGKTYHSDSDLKFIKHFSTKDCDLNEFWDERAKQIKPQDPAAKESLLKQLLSTEENKFYDSQLQLNEYVTVLLLTFHQYNQIPLIKGDFKDMLGLPSKKGRATWEAFLTQLLKIYHNPDKNAAWKINEIRYLTRNGSKNAHIQKINDQHAFFINQLNKTFCPLESDANLISSKVHSKFNEFKSLAQKINLKLVMNSSVCHCLLSDLKSIEKDKGSKFSPLDKMAFQHLYSNIRSLAADHDKLKTINDINEELQSRVRQFLYFGNPALITDKGYQTSIGTALIKPVQEKKWLVFDDSYTEFEKKHIIQRLKYVGGVLGRFATGESDAHFARDKFAYKLGGKLASFVGKGLEDEDELNERIMQIQNETQSWQLSLDVARSSSYHGGSFYHKSVIEDIDPIIEGENIPIVLFEDAKLNLSAGLISYRQIENVENQNIVHLNSDSDSDSDNSIEVEGPQILQENKSLFELKKLIQICLSELRDTLFDKMGRPIIKKLHPLLRWGLSELDRELENMYSKAKHDLSLTQDDLAALISRHLFFINAEMVAKIPQLATFAEKKRTVVRYHPSRKRPDDTFTFADFLAYQPEVETVPDNAQSFVRGHILPYLSACTLNWNSLSLTQRFVLELGQLLMKEKQDIELTPQRGVELFIQAMPSKFTVEQWMQRCERQMEAREKDLESKSNSNEILLINVVGDDLMLFQRLRGWINEANAESVFFTKKSTLGLVETVLRKDPGHPKNQSLMTSVSSFFFSPPQASLSPVLLKGLQLLAVRLRKIEDGFDLDDELDSKIEKEKVQNLVSQYLFFLDDSAVNDKAIPDAINRIRHSLEPMDLPQDIKEKLDSIKDYLKIVAKRGVNSTSPEKVHFAFELGRLLVREAQERPNQRLDPQRLLFLQSKAFKCAGIIARDEHKIHKGKCGETIGKIFEAQLSPSLRM